LNRRDFSATISDISDHQKTLGRPITFKASSDGQQISRLKLSGEDNRLGESVVDRLAFSAKKLSFETMALSSMTISNTALAFNGDIVMNDAKTLKGKVHLGFRDADINTLAGGQSSALGDLGSNASGLISGGGGLKKLLKF